jgi:hypothetical protein
MELYACSHSESAVSASPQGKATSEITGITASGPSGSEAFFFVLLGKSSLPESHG